MNIVTPIPTAVQFTSVNVNTEAARRDNAQRETIPALGNAEQSAAESGLGSESDRVRSGPQQQPVTYERPQNQQGTNGQTAAERDNGEDPSAGKENAESRQQQEQARREEQEVDKLKARDQEVRAHENAHANVGGQYAGAPSYEYETGPDGRQYAVGGEVSIDISEASSPEETLRKMQQVKAAALAPAEPSAQDLRVASEATQKAAEARQDITKARAADTLEQGEQVSSSGAQGPDLQDIVTGTSNQAPTRKLNEDAVAESVGLALGADSFRRRHVIQSFYQGASAPRAESFSQQA